MITGPKGVAGDMFGSDHYELVLMDIEMPVMNGFEATSRIRAIEATKHWAWTPILFLTASDSPENLVSAIEAGGDDFLAKTVPEVVLQAKMKAMARIASLRWRLSIANQKLEAQASQDGLTGLCNRRYMDIRLDTAWVRAERMGKSFGMLMVDIDNFKKYNDHYGHPAGDECLRTVASALEGVVASSIDDGISSDAFAARYGGEEFAVIVPDVSDSAFEKVAETLLEQVRHLQIEHCQNDHWGIVTISIGGDYQSVALGPIRDMIRRSDQRLYRAKNKGRNQVVYADPPRCCD